MGWSYKGIFNLLGDLGNKGDLQSRPIHLPKTSTIMTSEKMSNLWVVLNPYTDCNISSSSVVNTYTYSYSRPGANVNLDVKAKIFFKDSATGKTHSIEIPGPIDSMFEITDEGERVTAAALATIVAALATATSLSLIPLYGYKIQRK